MPVEGNCGSFVLVERQPLGDMRRDFRPEEAEFRPCLIKSPTESSKPD
jgi:hypothetical protein